MSRNPFEHHHPHYHDEGEMSGMDPAQQSLADALRVSFGVLKIVMLVLVVVYLFSGVFTVADREVGVRLVFGQIVGETPEEQVLDKGLHFGWPYPIQQVVKVDMSQQQLALTEAFWFEVPAGEEGRTLSELRGGPLNPVTDGSVLTGDANVVHTRWTIKYRVRRNDAVEFLRNVGTMARAQELVRRAAEAGVIHAVSNVRADDLLQLANAEQLGVARLVERNLDAMQAGIMVEEVSFVDRAVPIEVGDAFQESSKAAEERAREIAEATRDAENTLSLLAGRDASGPLIRRIDAYEAADAAGDEQRMVALRSEIETALRELSIEDEQNRTYEITGEVAQRIREAVSYATNVRRETKAEADRFEELLAQYQENRVIVLNRRWQQVLQRLWGAEGGIVTYFITGERVLQIGPSAEEAAQAQIRGLERREEERRQRQQDED